MLGREPVSARLLAFGFIQGVADLMLGEQFVKAGSGDSGNPARVGNIPTGAGHEIFQISLFRLQAIFLEADQRFGIR